MRAHANTHTSYARAHLLVLVRLRNTKSHTNTHTHIEWPQPISPVVLSPELEDKVHAPAAAANNAAFCSVTFLASIIIPCTHIQTLARELGARSQRQIFI